MRALLPFTPAALLGLGLLFGGAAAGQDLAMPPGADAAARATATLEAVKGPGTIRSGGRSLPQTAVADALAAVDKIAREGLVMHEVGAGVYGGGHDLEPGYAEFGLAIPVNERFSVVPAYGVTSPDDGLTLGDTDDSHAFRLGARFRF